MLKRLKLIVDKRGWAYASWRLGFRDTWAVKQWFKRNNIPVQHKESVKTLIRGSRV